MSEVRVLHFLLNHLMIMVRHYCSVDVLVSVSVDLLFPNVFLFLRWAFMGGALNSRHFSCTAWVILSGNVSRISVLCICVCIICVICLIWFVV